MFCFFSAKKFPLMARHNHAKIAEDQKWGLAFATSKKNGKVHISEKFPSRNNILSCRN